MASIPLPALNIRPPADPSEGIQRLLTLRNLMQQGQLLPGQVQQQHQQIEATGLENQQRAQALKDQQAQTAAMQEWDGKSIDDLPGLVLKHGASATAVMGLKTGIIKQKQDLANLDKDTLDNESKRNDQLLGHIDTIRGVADPDQRAQTAKTQAAQILNAGLVKDPQTAQMVQSIAGGQFVPDDSHLDLMEKGLRSHSAMLADAKTQAESAEKSAQANKLNLETNPANPADPNIARQKYQGILQAIQKGGVSSVAPEDLQWARSHEASETKRTTQSDTLGVTSSNVSGPAGLAVVGGGGGRRPAIVPPANSIIPPSGGTVPGAPAANAPGPVVPAAGNLKQSLVDEIGQYKLNPQMLSRMSTKHPDIIAAVAQKYPDWNQPQYNAINHMVTSYTSGKDSQSINAINTAMGHVKELDDAVDALNNGNVKILNSLANKLGVQVGQSAPATFKLIVHRVGPEISSAYIPGGGGVTERIADEKDFNEDLAPNILHSNAAETVKLLRSKVGALENQWKNTVGRDDFQKRFISPAAQAAFDKFAGGGGSGGGGHVIQIGPKQYRYKGSGDTTDLGNYTEVTPK